MMWEYQYAAAMYFCALAMTVGLPEWAPANSYEQGFAGSMAFFAVMVVALIIGLLNQVLSELHKESGETEDQVRQLVTTLKQHGVDAGLRRRVLMYVNALNA